MTRSLVICLMLAVATAIAAAAAALVAGWGLLAAFGLYCASGSTSLVVAAVAAQGLRGGAAPIRPAGPCVAEEPVYA